MLTRDMSREHLSSIQTILDDSIEFLWLLYPPLLPLPLLLFVLLGSFDVGGLVGA